MHTTSRATRRRADRAHTVRRLARAAMFATVRGAAYAVGTTAGSALIGVICWWITNR